MKRFWIISASIIMLLVGVRLMLPYFLKKYINRQLKGLSEYYGHVNDISIHLLRGAYTIKVLKLMKVNQNKMVIDTIPFIYIPQLELSIEWKALMKGRLVGKINVEKPEVKYIEGTHKNENVRQDTSEFRILLDKLMPVTINRFSIVDGQIHYIDPNTKPALDIRMKHVNIYATNISNINKSKEVLPAKLIARGEAYEGKFITSVDYDPMNISPTFYLKTELTDINLVKLNDALKV